MPPEMQTVQRQEEEKLQEEVPTLLSDGQKGGSPFEEKLSAKLPFTVPHARM